MSTQARAANQVLASQKSGAEFAGNILSGHVLVWDNVPRATDDASYMHSPHRIDFDAALATRRV